MPYDVITITPELSTSAYALGHVLFTSTAIKLPHSKCKVINVDAVWADSEADNVEFISMFFKENTNQLGTIKTAPDITGVEIAANVLLGATRLVSNGENVLGGSSNSPTLLSNQQVNDAGSAQTNSNEIVLTQGSTRNTCYVQALYEKDSTDTYAADSLVITLHVEY